MVKTSVRFVGEIEIDGRRIEIEVVNEISPSVWAGAKSRWSDGYTNCYSTEDGRSLLTFLGQKPFFIVDLNWDETDPYFKNGMTNEFHIRFLKEVALWLKATYNEMVNDGIKISFYYLYHHIVETYA